MKFCLISITYYHSQITITTNHKSPSPITNHRQQFLWFLLQHNTKQWILQRDSCWVFCWWSQLLQIITNTFTNLSHNNHKLIPQWSQTQKPPTLMCDNFWTHPVWNHCHIVSCHYCVQYIKYPIWSIFIWCWWMSAAFFYYT